jgi:predicted glutamine amidotransferase
VSGLLGIVSREPVRFHRCVCKETRNLAGWGIAVHELPDGWSVSKQASGATADQAYEAAMSSARGSILLRFVRARTVGLASFENMPPSRQGDWIFANDGKINRGIHLRSTIPDAASEMADVTDTQALFAFLMARLATRGTALRSRFFTEMVLARAVEDLASIHSLGDATFLLSDGSALYAYRQGPTLFLLDRRGDRTPDAIMVASKPVTLDEQWEPISEGTLLVVWREPRLGWATMAESCSDRPHAPPASSTPLPANVPRRIRLPRRER